MAIFVYPMLSSSAVSPAALPGIAKVLERYVLIYWFDHIMKVSKVRTKQTIQITTGQRLRLKEDGGLLFLDDFLEEQKISKSATEKDLETQLAAERKKSERLEKELERAKGKADQEKIRDLERELRDSRRDYDRTKKDLDRARGQREKEEREREIAKDRRERAKVDVRTTQLGGTITAEPTWVKIDTHIGPSLIGVKVIPFPVRSDATLAELVMSDRQLGFIMSETISTYRKIIKNLYKLWYATVGKLPFLKRSPITGDIRRDVIFNRSIHRDNVFVCFSMMDFDNEFFQSAGGITKLYKLGWNSFVVADDVNKRATFCMKPFRGLCSTVQYSFIYSSLEQSKVYEDLEDVRRAASPFFKMTTKASRLVGECLATSKMEEYLPEPQVLEEDIKSFARRLTPTIVKRVGEELDKAVLSKNVSKIKNIVSKLKIPEVSMSSIEQVAHKNLSGFRKSYELSKKVISNSLPNLPSRLVEPVSAAIAIKSSLKKEDVMGETRKNLKDVVSRLRTPEAQKQIKTEKAIVVVLSSLFAAGTIGITLLTAISEGWIVAGLVFTIIMALLAFVSAEFGVTRMPPEEVV